MKNLNVSVVGFVKDSESISNSINQSIETLEFDEQNFNNNDSNINEKNDTKKPMTSFFKYYLFFYFITMFFLYGTSESFLGPALPDLTKLLNTDAEHISYAYSFKILVYCFSTIFVSFSFNRFGNRELQYCLAIILIGITYGLTPFLKSFEQFLCLLFFSGFSCAFIDSVTSLVILEIFSVNSKIYIQSIHLAYTIGSVFGPLIIGLFLSKEIPIDDCEKNLLANTLSLLESSNSDVKIERSYTESNIKVPYLIACSLLICGSIFFIISQAIQPYIPEKRKLGAKTKSSKKTTIPMNQSDITISTIDSALTDINLNPEIDNQTIELPKSFYVVFLGLVGLLISVYNCSEMSKSLFVPTYLSKGDLKIDTKDAAFMVSVLNMASSSGKILSILLSHKLTCKNILFFNTSLVTIGYVILTFLARKSEFLTWISMFVLGFGYSSTYGIIFSFIENRIVISNNVQLYLLFSGGVLLLFIPVFIGHFINTIPIIFPYVGLTFAILAFTLMVSIHFVDVWKKKLIDNMKEDKKNIVDKLSKF